MRITIDSRLKEVRKVGKGVMAFCLENGLARDDAAMVELAVVEAVNNAVIHAYGGSDQGKVQVDMTQKADDLVFAISDWGVSFDMGKLLARLDQPREDDPLEESGRGLGLMRQIMDRMDYQSHGGSNTMLLVKTRVAE